jgi:O-antigen/teichoic acid export membrane protein
MTSAVANARWVGTIQAVRIGAQLLGLLILSRLVAPEDFGLVAMAFAISNFALLIRDLGSGAALIQRAVLEPDTVATAHWSNCFIGAVLGIALFLLAGPFEVLLKAPALEPLLQVLALSFPILGSTTVHQALLERESRFALLARIEISAVLAGLLVAVVSALLGAGAYSLVLQTLTVAMVSALQLWIATGLETDQDWSLKRARELWRFSGHLLGFNIINYFARNADTMIIGRVLGAASLGPYSLAYRIMLFPVQNLTFVAARALLPVMSRTQDAVAQLGSLYLRTLSVIAFFTAPLMAGLFVLREPFVAVALDESWSSVAQIIAWLAPVGFVQSLVSAGGVVMTALGRTDALFKLGLFGTAVHVGAFVVGVAWGVTGVAAAYLVAALLNAAVCFFVFLRLLSQPATRLAGAVLPAIARALLMALAVHFVDLELAALTVAPSLRLVVLSVGGAVFYLALTRAPRMASECDVWRLLLKKA